MITITDLVRASEEAKDLTQDGIVQDALHAIRTHLGMDVAFLAEFRGGIRVYRHIDSALDLPILLTSIQN